MLTANIHSIETLGLVDGPGIRTVIFFKGCPLKCQYCHNPDTQAIGGGDVYTVEELVSMAKRYRAYYDRTGGGVTLSGGEVLLQAEFALELAKALKEEGIHVALDTSGYGQIKYAKSLLETVDLVLLDIKHVDDISHKQLVGKSMKGLHAFLQLLTESNVPVWVRHVMVPTITDSFEILEKVYGLTKTFRNRVEKFEILPYHKLGIEKYNQLGIEYPLMGIPEMNHDVAKEYETLLNERLIAERDIEVTYQKRQVG